MSDELEHERLMDRFHSLMETADVNPAQRLELRMDPELAVELLEYALGRPKIRNPAAFTVSRFRDAIARRAAEDRAHDVEPLTVAEAEAALEAGRRFGVPAFVERELVLAVAAANARELASSS